MELKTKLYKTAASLIASLVCCAFLLAGCGPSSSYSGQSGGNDAPPDSAELGGWVEKNITPEEIPGDVITDLFVRADGNIVLVTYNRDENLPGALSSTDKGYSWQQINNSGLKEFLLTLENAPLVQATPLADGSWYVLLVPEIDYTSIFSDDGTVIPFKDGEEAPQTRLYHVLPDGEATELNLPFFAEAAQNKDLLQCYNLMQSPSGTVVLQISSAIDSNMLKYVAIDSAKGEQLAVIDANPQAFLWGQATIRDESLYLLGNSGELTSYSLQTGALETARHVPAPRNNLEEFVFTIGSDKSFCYIDKAGIYTAQEGEERPTHIVSGTHFAFFSTSFSPQTFMASDDGFLLLCRTDSGSKLYRYVYDKDFVPNAGNTISIWAMEDSFTLRAAIGSYAQANPDTSIDVQYGHSDENSGMLNEDIIRALNVRLLANDCPDVLILDGLPFDSYAKNEILMDLTGLIDLTDKYENIMQAYVRDGKAYAYPARFRLPLFYTPQQEGVNKTVPMSLQDIAAISETPGEIVFDNYTNMFEILYAGYSSEIFPQGSSVNEEALHTFFAATKRISTALELTQNGETYYGGYGNMGYITPQSLGAMNENDARCAVDLMLGLDDLNFLFGAHGAQQVRLLPGESFVPMYAGAIPAGAQNKQGAKQFIQLMIDDSDTQNGRIFEGLSVRVGAQQQYFESSKANSIAKPDPYFTNPAYPADFDWTGLIQGVNKVSISESVLRDKVFDQASRLYNGETTVDDATKAVLQSTQLYFDERA